ncbi:MAG: VIT domain-containing protein [Hyphomonadaceae bacterium]|nr:VIT domain-containing protein [Hyphomonadaceae bacterium]
MTTRLTKKLLAAASALMLLHSCAATAEEQAYHVKEQKKEQDRAGPQLIAYADGVHTEANKRDLGISSLEIDVNVRGDIAETTVTVAFDNPTNNILEGQFALNMARGAVVTGYALDINGTLIDGVLETKYKAAEAYQRRVNVRIDPGLAEVDYSDRFETRIYPIPANGSRIIRLRMVSLFDPTDGYSLPLSVGAKIKHFKLNIDGEAKILAVPEGLPSTGKKIEAEAVSLKGPLRLAAANRDQPMLIAQHPGAERFFDITAPAARATGSQRGPLHIFWDRSVSRTDDELTAEAQLAQDMATRRGARRVAVTLFDSGKAETIEVATDQLAARLGDVRYRGGTSYMTLTGVSVAKGADCLMFSDGRVSIDDRANFRLPCSVTAISSGPERDAAWLTDITDRSGGAFATLTKSNGPEVLTRVTRPDAAITSVTDSAGKAIEAVRLASDPRSFHIVGPLPADGVVLVSLSGETSPRRFTSSSSRTPNFAGPGALWARQRLGVEASEKKPDDLAAMARRYNVATPQASFVVLEAPNDYVQSDIAPPSSYPKQLQVQYAELRANADRSERTAREGRLTQVVAMWDAQKTWWDKKFDGKIPESERKAAAESASRSRAESPSPTMSPPPPAPAMAVPPREAVAVTGSMVAGAARDALSAEAISAEAEGDVVDSGRAGKIEVADWSADRPYLDRFDKAGADYERAIDREMKEQGLIPLFWFDVAEWHWRAGRKEEARRSVEAALDVPTRDNQTLAIVAARLVRYGSHDRAIWLLERLMERETDRPQPMRTLALALIDRAKYATTTVVAKADLGRAIELLAKAATSVTDVSARGIETVVLMEANAALAKLKAMGGSSSALDPRLIALLDTDVRVVMEWNTPRTDLDLWVTEPKGAKVGYSYPLSPWGGKLSGDVTNGYGPEEYIIHRANSGKYEVRAKTFASDRANPNGPSTLTVRLIRNFGRPSQSEELIDLEMPAEDRGEMEVGVFTLE